MINFNEINSGIFNQTTDYKLRKIYLILLKAYVPAINLSIDDLITLSGTELTVLCKQHNISELDLKFKVIYLLLLTQLAAIIVKNIHYIYPFSAHQLFEDRLRLTNHWLAQHQLNYYERILIDLLQADVIAFSQLDVEQIKYLFEYTSIRFWQMAYTQVKYDHNEKSQQFEIMLAITAEFLAIPQLHDYCFNLFVPYLMQIFYEVKDDLTPRHEWVRDLDSQLQTICSKKRQARSEQYLDKTGAAACDIIDEVLIFDFPKRLTIFDQLRAQAIGEAIVTPLPSQLAPSYTLKL